MQMNMYKDEVFKLLGTPTFIFEKFYWCYYYLNIQDDCKLKTSNRYILLEFDNDDCLFFLKVIR